MKTLCKIGKLLIVCLCVLTILGIFSNESAVAATTYTISYNANLGSRAPASQTKTYGVNLTLSTTKPYREGFTFLGWSESQSATTATYSAGGTFTKNANTTLYAVWEVIKCTISFNANGGTGAPGAVTGSYRIALTLPATVPTYTGYDFLGWSTSANSTAATYKPGSRYTPDKDVTLYAVWQIKKYTISYNAGLVREPLQVRQRLMA